MRLIDADLLKEELPRKRTMSMCLTIDECIEWNKMVDRLKILIDNQQTVNTNQWILCKERPPTKEEYAKNNGRFIVTDGNISYQTYFDFYKTFRFGEQTMNGFRIDRYILAWMELPEPYEK